ncbi:unnamed protein product [Ixodes persulcatus]
MMDAQDGNIATTTENAQSAVDKLYNLGFKHAHRSLTEDEALAQCVFFFLAGQDTTSSAISFTLYLLAIHPEIQAKLREEVDDCFKKHGPEPSLDVISKLRYLHAVLSESLRMFPPAARL